MGNTTLNHEEETRVIALDFAAKMIDYTTPDINNLLSHAARIENYIRSGEESNG